jgi:hypothetical protein
MSADSSNPEHAFFQKVGSSGSPTGERVPVHFNPNSLQYTITNTMRKQGQGKSRARQHVSESTGKLAMDVVFDTTDTGADVRTYTEKITAFMRPDAQKAPPVVRFEWGTFIFTGIIENYKETLDFFAPVGVPLRASLNLTMSSQDKIFELEQSDNPPSFRTAGALSPNAIDAPAGSAAGAAAQGGDPDAARALGAANGMESLRFSSGASLTVDPAISLGGPVAFASGGIGLSAGISGGISASAGSGIGGSAGFSASAGVGFGAGASLSAGAGLSAGAAFGAGAGASIGAGASVGTSLSVGASASAGVSATQGAFAGLRVSTRTTPRTSRLDASKLIQSSAAVGVATDSRATFALGGQAKIEGSTGLSANVGATASLKARITFD